MPTYTYKTRVRGQIKSGEVDAEDEKSAIAKLRSQKIRINSVKKKGGSSDFFGPRKQKVTGRDIVVFTRQFSTMVDAGLPLVQCLDILGRQSENKTFGEIITNVKTNIETGSDLSASMRKHPGVGLWCVHSHQLNLSRAELHKLNPMGQAVVSEENGNGIPLSHLHLISRSC